MTDTLSLNLYDAPDEDEPEHYTRQARPARGRLLGADAQRAYVLAPRAGGSATVTLLSPRTGVRYTYKVSAPATGDEILFVKLLTGSDNNSSYTYLGTIRKDPPRYAHGARSTIRRDAPGATAIGWYLTRLFGGASVDGVEVWHEGRCGRCGRKLTVPSSVASGFGEECAAKRAGQKP